MGATSPGFGRGTTVFFELPLFSCVSAGKQPLASSAAASVLPPPPPRSESIVAESSISSAASGPLITDGREYSNPVLSGPTRIKPRPSSSRQAGAVVAVTASNVDVEASTSSLRNTQPPHQHSDIDEAILRESLVVPDGRCEEKENKQHVIPSEQQRISFLIVVPH